MDDRTERYRNFIPEEVLFNTHVSIIGLGAIGRQVALQCAAMGFLHFTLWDFDTVDETNLGTQGYRPTQVGNEKAIACYTDVVSLNPSVADSSCCIPTRFEKLPSPFVQRRVVFVCVDSMASRKEIAEKLKDEPKAKNLLLIDGRMQRSAIRLVSANLDVIPEYLSVLYTDEEAAGQGDRCTARTTIFMASIAAGLMINRWVEYIKHTRTGFCDDMFHPDFLLSIKDERRCLTSRGRAIFRQAGEVEELISETITAP